MKNFLTPKIRTEICDPIIVNPAVKMRLHPAAHPHWPLKRQYPVRGPGAPWGKGVGVFAGLPFYAPQCHCCQSIDFFYRYSGHIELIRFKEYYGMQRGRRGISIFWYVRLVLTRAFRGHCCSGSGRVCFWCLTRIRSGIRESAKYLEGTGFTKNWVRETGFFSFAHLHCVCWEYFLAANAKSNTRTFRGVSHKSKL